MSGTRGGLGAAVRVAGGSPGDLLVLPAPARRVLRRGQDPRRNRSPARNGDHGRLQDLQPLPPEASPMPELTSVHPDELLLLRYAVRELDAAETRTIEEHATFCRTCARRIEQMLALDAGLKAAFDDGAPAEEVESSELPEGDPFRRRPGYTPRHAVKSRSATLIAAFAREASDRSAALREQVRSAVADPKVMSALLAELSLSDPAVRYALLYAMQD